MRQFLLYIIFLSLFFSCKEVYYPDIETDEQVLVVDGLITGENTSYQIKLSYSVPFDESELSIPVNGAEVKITDNNGLTYQFQESSTISGLYLSKPNEFIAVIGNEYTLSIVTNDGETYESKPQKLLGNINPLDVYGVKTVKNFLVEKNGDQTPITKEGANIILKFNSSDNAIPRFKFKSAYLNGYSIQGEIPLGNETIYFTTYGWEFSPYTSDYILTSEKYTINTNQISNQEACFFHNLITDEFQYYKPQLISRDLITFEEVLDSVCRYYISKRILYLAKYRLNDDAYKYYQAIDKQLNAENKIFDPSNPQIIGNITCTSDPDKLAFGFFETSSVEYLSYFVVFDVRTGNPTLYPANYNIPDLKAGITATRPDFWDN